MATTETPEQRAERLRLRRAKYAQEQEARGKTVKPRRGYTTRVANRPAEEKRELYKKTRRENYKAKRDAMRARVQAEAEAERARVQAEATRHVRTVSYYQANWYAFDLQELFFARPIIAPRRRVRPPGEPRRARQYEQVLSTRAQNIFPQLDGETTPDYIRRVFTDRLALGVAGVAECFRPPYITHDRGITLQENIRLFDQEFDNTILEGRGRDFCQFDNLLREPGRGVRRKIGDMLPPRARMQLNTKLFETVNEDDNGNPMSEADTYLTKVIVPLINELYNESGTYWVVWGVSVSRITQPQRDAIRQRNIFTQFLRDGDAPRLCLNTPGALETPTVGGFTCIQDLLKKYDKQCSKLSTQEISMRIVQCWDKYRQTFRSSPDFKRCYASVLGCGNIEYERELTHLYDYGFDNCVEYADEERKTIARVELTASHFIVYCFYNRIRLNILDDDMKLIMRVLTKEQVDTNKPAIFCYIHSGHVYDVVCKSERLRIRNLRDNHVQIKDKDEDEEQSTTDNIVIDDWDTAVQQFGEDCTKRTHYTLHYGVEQALVEMYEKHNVLPSSKCIRATGSMPTSVTFEGITVSQVAFPDETLKACKIVGQVYNNMSLPTLTTNLFDKFESDHDAFSLKSLRSHYNNQSLRFINAMSVKAVNFNVVDRSVNESMMVTKDIRRCYTSCLIDIKKWLCFDVFDDVKVYNGETLSSSCVYYVETPLRNALLEGSAVYTYDVVYRAVDDGMISPNDITHYMMAKEVEYDFQPFVKYVYDTFTVDDDDTICKHMINGLIGMLNFRVGKTTKLSYTSSINDVVDKYFRLGWSGYTKLHTKPVVQKKLYLLHKEKYDENDNFIMVDEIQDRPLYKVFKFGKVKNPNELGICVYAQIVQRARCDVYDLFKQVKVGKVVQMKTDSISILYDSPERDVLTKNCGIYDIGALRDTVRSTMEMDDFEEVPIKEYAHQVVDQAVLQERGDDLRRRVVEGGESISIIGRAGSGKSTLGNLIINDLKALGKKVICTAFQNITVERFGLPEDEAMTCHKLFGIDVEGTCTSFKNMKADVIVFEEVSMIPSTLYKHMLRIKNENPTIQFIALGHWAQLAPVGESHINFKDSNVFKSMFPATVYLSENHRSGVSPELTRIQDDLEFGRIGTDEVKKLINNGKEYKGTDINLVVSNRVRKQVNRMYLPSSGIGIQSDDTNKYLQSYNLATGQRLIKINNDTTTKYSKNMKDVQATFKQCVNISNGSLFVVKSITEGVATLALLKDFTETENTIDVVVDRAFGYIFQPAFALTIYKAQGCNIPSRHTIWELDRVLDDRRYVYTSITRATRFEDIYIM